jgi:esterase/lipase superfamily enzyme
LDYSVLNKEEEKDTKTAATPMEITKMTDKELFLIVCEALETGGQNTKTKREREHNTEAKRSIVEIVVRKWNWDIDNFKDAMKMLAQPDFTNKQDRDDSDSNYLTEISGESESSSSDSSEDEDEEAPLLFVDVNLGPSEQKRIVVFEGDDARSLAEQFCGENDLDDDTCDKLEHLLKQ